jgi:predicted  nucleic acid-binding Zn-ribbon protein
MTKTSEQIEEEALIKWLLDRQPSSKDEFEFLRRRFAERGGHGVFAPIKGVRCGACNLSVARARLQQARNGMFIACANCARFLYWPAAVPPGGQSE